MTQGQLFDHYYGLIIICDQFRVWVPIQEGEEQLVVRKAIYFWGQIDDQIVCKIRFFVYNLTYSVAILLPLIDLLLKLYN